MDVEAQIKLAIYVLRRLALFVPVLFGITVLAFVLTRALPGNPIDTMVPRYASQAIRDNLTQKYGLDQPIYVQYLVYLRNLVRGDLGVSFTTSKPVVRDLADRWTASVELTTCSMVLAVGLGLPLGLATAARRESWLDHVGRIVSVMGVSLPVFWTGLILIYVIFFRLGWVPPPVGRIDVSVVQPHRVTGLYTIDSILQGNVEALVASVGNLILPVVTLGFSAMAPIARMMRSEAIEVLDSDYIRAARSLGLPERTVFSRHVLKNAFLPVVTMIALVYGYMLGSSVLVEKIFSWPGLGLYAFNAAASADYPALQGFILAIGLLYSVLFLGLDIVYALLDPRIRY